MATKKVTALFQEICGNDTDRYSGQRRSHNKRRSAMIFEQTTGNASAIRHTLQPWKLAKANRSCKWYWCMSQAVHETLRPNLWAKNSSRCSGGFHKSCSTTDLWHRQNAWRSLYRLAAGTLRHACMRDAGGDNGAPCGAAPSERLPSAVGLLLCRSGWSGLGAERLQTLGAAKGVNCSCSGQGQETR